ncbi:hypothetical protein Vi05172_g8254 [Venturia inaequalis]|nr:hypothetical protein Vi05172_g8254 [Venturia inaequalis]
MKVIWLTATIMLISIRFDLPDEAVATLIAAHINTLVRPSYFPGTIPTAKHI